MLTRTLSLAALLTGILAEAAPRKTSVSGLTVSAEPEKGIITLMKPVGYNPKDAKLAEMVRIRYSGKTVFTERKNFVFKKGEKNEFVAHFALLRSDRKKMNSGEKFNVRILDIIPGEKPNPKKDLYSVVMTSNDMGILQLNGKEQPFRAYKGSYVMSPSSVGNMTPGLAEAAVSGTRNGDVFEAKAVLFRNLPDPAADDDPKLPRVLVIADSISMNYNDSAKEFLKGSFNYHRIYGNSSDTRNGVNNLWHWLGPMRTPRQKWDIVLVNHGLHDLKQGFNPKTKVFSEKHQVEPEDYRKNFEKILNMLSKFDFKIIVATTTPVANDQFDPGRRKDEDLKYNAVLLEVVKKFPKVRVLDLNKLVRTNPAFDQWKKGHDVHFKPAESRVLGKAVADCIRETYGEKNGK